MSAGLSVRDVVPIVLDRVGQLFMYVSPLKYTSEKLGDVKDDLQGTIKDVLSSLEEARMNGSWPANSNQAGGWLRQGLEKMNHADKIKTKYDEQFAGPSTGVVLQIMLHCPCDTYSRRMFNAEAVMRINQLKEHKAGGNIYVTGEPRRRMSDTRTLEERIDALFEVDPLRQSQIIGPLLTSAELPVTRMGPEGSEDGADRDIDAFFPLLCEYRNFDDKIAPERLESVTIRSGGVIDEFSFSYIDQRGERRTVGPWGAGGPTYCGVHTITLRPSEVVTGISGTMGRIEHTETAPTVITSLRIVTNIQTYGPIGDPIYYGAENNTPFSIVAPPNKTIVGFFGRSSRYVNAIGVYTI